MKKTYLHIHSTPITKFDWNDTLMFRATSKILWKDQFISTLLKYFEKVLVVAVSKLSLIKTYQDPLSK